MRLKTGSVFWTSWFHWLTLRIQRPENCYQNVLTLAGVSDWKCTYLISQSCGGSSMRFGSWGRVLVLEFKVGIGTVLLPCDAARKHFDFSIVTLLTSLVGGSQSNRLLVPEELYPRCEANKLTSTCIKIFKERFHHLNLLSRFDQGALEGNRSVICYRWE